MSYSLDFGSYFQSSEILTKILFEEDFVQEAITFPCFFFF